MLKQKINDLEWDLEYHKTKLLETEELLRILKESLDKSNLT